MKMARVLITRETIGRIGAALNEKYGTSLNIVSKKAVSKFCRTQFLLGNISRENALRRAAEELGIEVKTHHRTHEEKKAEWARRKSESTNFLHSPAWRQLRYQVLKRDKAQCLLCGATRAGGATLHVDHIKPRSVFPELSLEISNLQTLCEDCNMGKTNTDATDWRSESNK